MSRAHRAMCVVDGNGKCGAQYETYGQSGRNVRHYAGCAIADAKRRLAALPGEHR